MTDSYIHGTAATEQGRLSLLNDLINQASLREIGLRGGEKILDVGCGLAQLTRAMGRAAGSTGRVVGVERDARQRQEALRQAREEGEENLVEIREGNALALPLAEAEWGTFDVAHARFVLEHVRDPLSVVRQMARAVRPGGRVVLEDDDHDVLRLWPEPPGLGPLWQAYVRAYDRLGNDPYVGRRLVALLHEAGALPRRNTWLFFGSCPGNPTFQIVVNNLADILAGARAAILAEALLDRSCLEEGLAALKAWGRRPDAAFWYSTCWAEGVRPD
jgi:ubiquinone/menaquinone biosynthesis C-methylase UbiE